MKSSAHRLLLAGVVIMHWCTTTASAAEVCRFVGTTDYAGHITVTTTAATMDGLTKIDVNTSFESTSMFWFGVHYLVEEVSTWRAGRLETVALNSRYLLGTHIVRQQWDYFQRGPEGLYAHRVQAKTLTDFSLRHPGFVRHWDPATFGQPWLQDYQSAPPERRIDLDLPGPLPLGLKSPLALAFYWVRWLPHGDHDMSVFLPGFKAERLVHLPITSATSAAGSVWRAPLHYPSLSKSRSSIATAWVSLDGHLLRMTFELHTIYGSGRGVVEEKGCDGAPVVPVERGQ